jgi:prepilin-type N-terminal cleavage/methylation domain-containing protein
MRLRKMRAFTLVELLVVIAIIGILVALLLPAIQAAREASRRTACMNNLKNLSLAMLNHESAKRVLPPGAVTWVGDPYGTARRPGPGAWYDDHGWYSYIAPFIEENAWYDSLDLTVSMSHERNDAARRYMMPIFGCPSDGLKRNEWQSRTWARVRGNYAVNFGNTNYGQTTKSGVAFGGAPFSYRKSSRTTKLTDGASNTLMMSEVVTVGEIGAPWGGPVSEIQISVGGQTFQGWLTPNSDASDQTVRVCPPPTAMNGMPPCTLIGGADQTVNQTFASRSKHPGGVFSSRCDGSVTFYSEAIDLAAWRALSTARGGEGPALE